MSFNWENHLEKLCKAKQKASDDLYVIKQNIKILDRGIKISRQQLKKEGK